MPAESKAKCDARCWNSKTKHCECVCQGANHGKGEAGKELALIESGDKIGAEELTLFVQNDSDLHRQQEVPIQANLLRRMKNGTYDSQKAVRLWEYLAESGAKKYTKENGSGTGFGTFNKGTRHLSAIEMRNIFEQEVRSGGAGQEAQENFLKLETKRN